MSTKTKKVSHTPEPWSTKPEHPGMVYVEGKPHGDVIANCNYMQRPKNFDEENTNAVRIAACVNACAGIEDPVGALHELVNAVKDFISYHKKGARGIGFDPESLVNYAEVAVKQFPKHKPKKP